MELVIHREVIYLDLARSYRVYVDDKYLGSLKNGDTKFFVVSDDVKTIEIKQALSFFKSQKHNVQDHNGSSVHLNISMSRGGILSNLLLFAFLGFFFLQGLFSWDFGGTLFQIIPFCLIFIAIVFIGSAHRYIVIKPTDNAIFQ